ncbi:glutathione S-transferase N-terminal domain-containing protein [Alkalilimnicola sp. S0819]|uniref:glutathione S-transferase N-terminal domain-containing protein n=1 Tax=Alkalilimnicola sp. S0819 TaxID=2613922 RepID=UPI0012625657|nr:glutathione S-transferase N-terminal domain-containing protein [Alkalilimnicola sp. S0819]KAB7623357.1 glutaredoxin [Alkalilimnicola sp. S0819]MPQ16896.1 glutaredoxin [Alkalilimnicola sp. S0819]
MQKPKHLALYNYYSCPFCMVVRDAIRQLGVDVENRDTLKNPAHKAELVEQGGRGTVPCLRIEHADGEVEWMYESAVIVDYLKRLAA